jgi:hypothetical protein
LDNIPGTTIYDFFTDDDFKAYGIHWRLWLQSSQKHFRQS